MNNILINRPKMSDKNLINEFFEKVLIHTIKANEISHIEGILKEELLDKKYCLDQYFTSNGQDRFFLIASDDKKIVGTIEFGKSNDLINDCTNNKLKDMFEIGTVFVHPDYQRHGIANLLFKNIFMELSKRKVTSVCFDSGYKLAQKIWVRKFGQPKYFLKNYWSLDSHHMIWLVDVENELKKSYLKNV